VPVPPTDEVPLRLRSVPAKSPTTAVPAPPCGRYRPVNGGPPSVISGIGRPLASWLNWFPSSKVVPTKSA
jgi:hypothetical protein